MANINRGVMTKMDGDRYIIVNPDDLAETLQLLDVNLGKVGIPDTKTHIDYNVFAIDVGPGVRLAAVSTSPQFYFDLRGDEYLRDVLKKAGIKHLVGSSQDNLADVKNIDGVRQKADSLQPEMKTVRPQKRTFFSQLSAVLGIGQRNLDT